MKAPTIITIPFVPMSRNARDRAHWAERARELDDWKLLIPNCEAAHKQRKGDPRRLVEIVFRKARGPLSDPDNLHARCKVPLDALVHRGWILDDSPKHIVLQVREEVTGKRGSTHIAVSKARSTDVAAAAAKSKRIKVELDLPVAKPVTRCPDGERCERGCRGGCYRVTYGELKAA